MIRISNIIDANKGNEFTDMLVTIPATATRLTKEKKRVIAVYSIFFFFFTDRWSYVSLDAPM